MPTIRVDEDVFEGLKKLAEPFVDTPNSVIRALLQAKGVLSKPEQPQPGVIENERGHEDKAQSSSLTPQSTYEQFLLYVLAQSSTGSASKADATRRVMELMKQRGFIGPAELERVSTGETKAENTIAWGRNALKERGLISRNSPKGTWQLTTEGINRGKAIRLPDSKNTA